MEWARDECSIIKTGDVFEECRKAVDDDELHAFYASCVDDTKELVQSKIIFQICKKGFHFFLKKIGCAKLWRTQDFSREEGHQAREFAC